MKRLPSLQVNLLGDVFSPGPLSEKAGGRAKNVVQVRHSLGLETTRRRDFDGLP